MGKDKFRSFRTTRIILSFGLSLKWSSHASHSTPGPLFTSVSSQVGAGFGATPNPNSSDKAVKFQLNDMLVKDVYTHEGFRIVGVKDDMVGEAPLKNMV